MAVPLQPGADPRPGAPTRLFMMPAQPDPQTAIFEDVTPDGQRILLNVPTTARSSIGFHAIHGWTALLRAGAADAAR